MKLVQDFDGMSSRLKEMLNKCMIDNNQKDLNIFHLGLFGFFGNIKQSNRHPGPYILTYTAASAAVTNWFNKESGT